MSYNLFRRESDQGLFRRLDWMLWTILHRVTWGNPRQAHDLGMRITLRLRRFVRLLEQRP